MKTRISPKSAKPSAIFGAEGSAAGLPNLPNLPFLEFGSQSNSNSESSKSTVFKISTNQTHPESNDVMMHFEEFGMCTIVIEVLKPFNRTSRVRIYKDNAPSRLFCRIAKISI